MKAMKMKTGFRNTQWDPFLLIAQIIAIQSVLYVSLGFMMAIMDVFVDANHTLDHLFQYHVRPRSCVDVANFRNFDIIKIVFLLMCLNFKIYFHFYFHRKFTSPMQVVDQSFFHSP